MRQVPNKVKFVYGEDARHMARELWAMGYICRLDGRNDMLWVYDPKDELDRPQSILPYVPEPFFTPVGDHAYYNGVFYGQFGSIHANDAVDVGYEFRNNNIIVQALGWEWDRQNRQWFFAEIVKVTARDQSS